MKTHLFLHASALCLAAVMSLPANLAAQGTAFTYQGRLTHGENAANGLYEINFTLYGAATTGNVVGTPVTVAPVPVSNGLFTATLDFGAATFMGADRWLEISVTVFGSDQPVVTLVPRQHITPTPYAIHAANAAGLMNTANAPLDIKVNGQRALRLESTAGGTPNLVAGSASNFVSAAVGATISGGGSPARPNVIAGADYGTVAGGERQVIGPDSHWSSIGGGFLNAVGEISIAATIAGGYQNSISSNAPFASISGGTRNFVGGRNSHIGGGDDNAVSAEAGYSTIGGGVANSVDNAESGTITGGDGNLLASDYATISGGLRNTIQTNASRSTIGGGAQNSIFGSATLVTIGGGGFNVVRAGANGATIGGGLENIIQNSVDYATVAGGSDNSIESHASHATISGGNENLIQTFARGATIGGGIGNSIQAAQAAIGGGLRNEIRSEARAATVHGGTYNIIGTNAQAATIGGGDDNTIDTHAAWATIGGGLINVIKPSSFYAIIAGGFRNTIDTNADTGTIGGGSENIIAVDSNSATISGGRANTVGTNANFATIPGGLFNTAAAYAFAAGYAARATNQGAFVWSDSVGTLTHSTNDNSVTFRARGGYRLFSDGEDSGVCLPSGSGSWSSLSDRNAKENFAAANSREILDKVAALPLASWNYKAQDKSIRHLGPMAQDFHAAFGLGESDRTITTVDADGVALAAIQGLNQKVEEKEARIQTLEKELSALKELVAKLSTTRN